MGDLAAAAAMMDLDVDGGGESAAPAAAESGVQEAATPAQTAPEAAAEEVAAALGAGSGEAAEAPAAPDPDAEAKEASRLRVAEMQARIDALKARNRERTQRASLGRIEAEIRAREEAAARAEAAAKEKAARWERVFQDPQAALQELGHDPIEAYAKITKAAKEKDTPEYHEQKLVERIRADLQKEYEPQLKQVEELRAVLQQQLARQAQADSERAIATFQRELSDPKYELVRDEWDDMELVEMGDEIGKQLRAAGKPVSIPIVAQTLLRMAEAREKRRVERRATRTTPQSEAGQTATEQPKAAAAPAKTAATPTVTLTNDLAAATAASAKRPLTKEERQRAAAALLGPMIDRINARR
jgi:hypothetical protein